MNMLQSTRANMARLMLLVNKPFQFLSQILVASTVTIMMPMPPSSAVAINRNGSDCCVFIWGINAVSKTGRWGRAIRAFLVACVTGGVCGECRVNSALTCPHASSTSSIIVPDASDRFAMTRRKRSKWSG